MFANAIHNRGVALSNCWGLIDGTVRTVSRQGKNQRILYNGHKKVQSIKFQSVTGSIGLVANFYGPVEGKIHDSSLLMQSELLNKLQQYSVNCNDEIMCIYGDPAYPLRPQLQTPFQGAKLTEGQMARNRSISEVRVSVERLFGDIINYFKFLDFKKNLKLGLSAVGKMYLACALIENAHTCLYGSTTSQYPHMEPLHS